MRTLDDDVYLSEMSQLSNEAKVLLGVADKHVNALHYLLLAFLVKLFSGILQLNSVRLLL